VSKYLTALCNTGAWLVVIAGNGQFFKWLKINYMSRLSTQNQLVRLAYGELPLLERLETEHDLSCDHQLQEDYEELQRAKAALPPVTYSPSALSISAILAYSRNETLEMSA
jgi:hypothetical protein